ncbi:MAG: glycoside hydrolase family 127 protein [Bryobacteraceae bacterium]|nr:glycoside hydrolase family 127 protein [Bryobacteraceae bacterium]
MTFRSSWLAVCLVAGAAAQQDQAVLHLVNTPQAKVRPVPVASVKLQPGFWAERLDVNRRVSIPTLLKQFEDRGILDNFLRVSGKKQTPRKGPLYTDSDLYKWMEAVSFVLQGGEDVPLRSQLDRAIEIVAAAQGSDGYINTFYNAERSGERHTNMKGGHELYCGGHLIQAGIAYYRATGSRRLLDIGVRFADYLLSNFGPSKKPIFEGHPEMELALVELYRTTGKREYLDFAGYLLRGDSARIPLAQRDLVYLFTGKPFTERTKFEGHAVRAMYAASGATDYYLETADAEFWDTLQRLWKDAAEGKTYITGGVGSRSVGEAFGEPYELPNQLAYTESCAAIAYMMWNFRMLAATGEARFADQMERALYNGVNSGMSLSGDMYCYRNPLELTGNPEDKIRNPWYDTTCCPPNLERVLASLPGYMYGTSKDGVLVHLYHSSDVEAKLWDGSTVKLRQETKYPWDGDVAITVGTAKEFALSLRVPAWAGGAVVEVNGKALPERARPESYYRISRAWATGDTVRLRLEMKPRFTSANPRVRDNIGKVALERGPLVYCLEGVDQKVPFWEAAVIPGGPVAEFRHSLPGNPVALRAKGVVRESGGELYSPVRKPGAGKSAELVFIPYYAFQNRGATPMQVWVPYSQQ